MASVTSFGDARRSSTRPDDYDEEQDLTGESIKVTQTLSSYLIKCNLEIYTFEIELKIA